MTSGLGSPTEKNSPASLWRVGLAGVGVVGSGLLQLMQQGGAAALADARVTGICARERSRERLVDISTYHWFDDPVALAASPEVDLFVELIGGAEGAARAAVATALQAGKPVVTANKALIAKHGLELARLAEAHGAPLLFEAAVMGGAPAIKLLREGLVGDHVRTVAGVLNGTCNYILSEMETTGRPFAEVLHEAQRLGYAEADPKTDIGGFDAAHKVVILAALAFGGAPNLAAAEVEGIEAIEQLDIRLAGELGYRIKLIASASREDGGASVRVNPALVPLSHPLAQAGGALNALYIESERVGRLYLQGAGAGAGPTAVAVAADIADVIAGGRRSVFQSPASGLQPLPAADPRERVTRAFVRLVVQDRPGVLAAITEAFAKAEVSIDSLLQHPVEPTGLVPIVLTTHASPEAGLRGALSRIEQLAAVVDRPRLFRIQPV